MTTPKVCVINIGDELLLGKTINTNLSWLGLQLSELGLPISRSLIVADNEKEIKKAVQEAWQEMDITIVTGGLGPTKDDITKSAIAEIFCKKLVFKQEIWEQVTNLFTRRGFAVPEINRTQAMIPEDFQALSNEIGTAPGLYYRMRNKSLFVLPGVPLEMKSIYMNHIRQILNDAYPSQTIFQRTIHTWDISESALAELLNDVDVPQGLKLAWLPQLGRVDLRISGMELEKIQYLEQMIVSRVVDKIWGYDNDTPVSVLQDLMIKKNFTLSVAESCTGGTIQEYITSQAGSSNYFLGGVVSYHNQLKQKILSVSNSTITKYGAVSKQTAIAMAKGIRNLTNSDIGLSVTGIAGPEGSSAKKPVGTVWFGIATLKKTIVWKSIFNGDRNSIRQKSTEHIILSLIRFIRSEL